MKHETVVDLSALDYLKRWYEIKRIVANAADRHLRIRFQVIP